MPSASLLKIKAFRGCLAGGFCVANQGFYLAALRTLSYMACPDVLLQWSKKEPACFVCFFLKRAAEFWKK